MPRAANQRRLRSARSSFFASTRCSSGDHPQPACACGVCRCVMVGPGRARHRGRSPGRRRRRRSRRSYTCSLTPTDRDPQLFAGHDRHVRAAAPAQQQLVGRPEPGAAVRHGTHAGHLDDLQVRAGHGRALGGQIEAEPDRVRFDAGQLADLEAVRARSACPGAASAICSITASAIDNSCMPAQQIRGSGSPTSRSTIRVPPNAVLSSTSPGGSSAIRPMIAAPAPSGCARSAASAASA